MNRETFFNYLKACDVLVLMVGGGVGSNTTIGEALALGRKVITLDAGTNPFSYGPAAIFVNRLSNCFKYEGINFYAPDTDHLLKILLKINEEYQNLINANNEEEINYVKNVMSSEHLVENIIAPTIEIIKTTYDPATKYIDYSKIKLLYDLNYNKMKTNFDPTKYL